MSRLPSVCSLRCLLVALLFALFMPDVSDAELRPPLPALNDTPSVYFKDQAYFAVLGSFRTKSSAMRHAADLRRRSADVPITVYPPRHGGRYWIVVSAAFVTHQQAARHAAYFRRAHIQRDAYVWHLPRQPDGMAFRSIESSAGTPPADFPNLLRAASPSVPDASFVFIDSDVDEAAVRSRAADLRKRHPQLQIAVFPPRANETVWRIALGTNLPPADVTAALEIARRFGLSDTPEILTLPVAERVSWQPNDPELFAATIAFQKKVEACFRDGSITVGQMRACADAWVTPEVLRTCIGSDDANARLGFSALHACKPLADDAVANGILAARNITEATILELKASAYEQVDNVDALMQCSADAKDVVTLQRCVLPNLFSENQKAAIGCLAKGSDAEVAKCIAAALPEGADKEKFACLQSKAFALTAVAECSNDPNLLARLQSAQACLGAAKSQAAVRACLPLFGRSETQAKRAECLSAKSRADVIRCAVELDPNGAELLSKHKCVNTAGGDAAELTRCFENDIGTGAAAMVGCYAAKKTGAGLIECLEKGNPRLKTVNDLANCSRSNAGDAKAFLAGCSKAFLTAEDQKLADCLIALPAGASDATKTCSIPNEDAARLLKMAACTNDEKGNSIGMARCLVAGLPNSSADLETALCLSETGANPEKAALCAVPRLGGTGGAVAKCLATNPSGDPLRCVLAADPNLRTAEQVYNCVSRSTADAMSLVAGCTDGIVNKETQQALSCVAKAAGDSAALAACAGQALLPGEAGRLAGCAAQSQGGATAFALCAAGPKMNAEWQIAAECAASSGGEPISFASCTGGRLTLRELGKCLSGKIGKDCFGPNNTIRKFYTNMYHDLTRGPGPNNEIVKGVRAVGAGLEHLGEQVSKEVERRAENAKNRLGKPLENPGKTIECIVTLGNSCD